MKRLFTYVLRRYILPLDITHVIKCHIINLFLWMTGVFSNARSLAGNLCRRVMSGKQQNSKANKSASYSKKIPVAKPDYKVEIYKGTGHPTKCWEELRVKQVKEKQEVLPLDTPIYQDKVRFVCMSDTHDRMHINPPWDSIPPGDVFLHAGDFTMAGRAKEVESFNEFLGRLPHQHKIVIAGNHELSFDPEAYGSVENSPKFLKKRGISRMADLLKNCTYLEDSLVTVAGIKVYGSPWQPEFGNWAFNLRRGEECLEKWNKIPAGVDILMTHGPPIGHGDLCKSGLRAGCVELLSTVQNRVGPKYHIFGHIHEDYGVTTDGQTIYMNASTCTLRYRPDNPPIIFDIPLPDGCKKSDIVLSDSNDTVLPGNGDQTEKVEDKSLGDNTLYPGVVSMSELDECPTPIEYSDNSDEEDEDDFVLFGEAAPDSKDRLEEVNAAWKNYGSEHEQKAENVSDKKMD